MAALITTPVSGAYTAALNSNSLGVQDDSGYEISYSPKGQEINDTDQYGMTLIEGVYRGGDWRIRHKCMEWITGVFGALLQFGTGAATAAPNPALGVIGRKLSAIAQSLVLTATAATPAAALPATLTAAQAVLSPNNNFSFQLTSKVRVTPVEYCCLPYLVSTNAIPFSTT